MIIKLGEKEVDLDKAFPITLGDLKRMERENLMTAEALKSPSAISKVLLMLVQKTDKEITEEQLDSIPARDLAGLGEFLSEKFAEDRPDRPT